jgi:hypothetical protein
LEQFQEAFEMHQSNEGVKLLITPQQANVR